MKKNLANGNTNIASCKCLTASHCYLLTDRFVWHPFLVTTCLASIITTPLPTRIPRMRRPSAAATARTSRSSRSTRWSTASSRARGHMQAIIAPKNSECANHELHFQKSSDKTFFGSIFQRQFLLRLTQNAKFAYPPHIFDFYFLSASDHPGTQPSAGAATRRL